MVKENVAGAVIFYMEDNSFKYLLLKYRVHKQTHWDFVKGSLEKKEDFLEAAKRETFEETGIEDFKVLEDFVNEVSYSYTQDNDQVVERNVKYFLFEVYSNTKVKISGEHSAYKWLDFEEANKLLKFENQKNTLEKANYFLLG